MEVVVGVEDEVETDLEDLLTTRGTATTRGLEIGGETGQGAPQEPAAALINTVAPTQDSLVPTGQERRGPEAPTGQETKGLGIEADLQGSLHPPVQEMREGQAMAPIATGTGAGTP